jgi:hypothetical protein
MKAYRVYCITSFNVEFSLIFVAENEDRVKEMIDENIKNHHGYKMEEIDIKKESWYMISSKDIEENKNE